VAFAKLTHFGSARHFIAHSAEVLVSIWTLPPLEQTLGFFADSGSSVKQLSGFVNELNAPLQMASCAAESANPVEGET
jgi:hypothetical protein